MVGLKERSGMFAQQLKQVNKLVCFSARICLGISRVCKFNVILREEFLKLFLWKVGLFDIFQNEQRIIGILFKKKKRKQ